MIRKSLLLLLLAAPALLISAADLTTRSPSDLAVLASKGDAVALWRQATDSAASAVVAALRRQDRAHTVELLGTDLDELRIWHGQSVSLGLEADKLRYKWVVQSEPEWRSLAEVLPATQGGLLPKHDWDSIDRDWLSPVSRGSLLADFILEGPVDVYLTQPTALQLFLPHASDAGQVRRVLLRDGAAVVVRGARAVRLRRGIDLPAIGLSEFANIVTSDAQQQQPLGVMHLLAGVQHAAQAHWNSSHPDQSLGLVALELDFSPRGAALLAAPSGDGSSGSTQRLRVRRVKEGVIELLLRDGSSSGGAASGQQRQAGAVALRAPQQAAPVGAWPLRSVHPIHLQSYERLLREVVSSRLFKMASSGGLGRSGRQQQQQQQQFRVAQDVQLRLLETEAEATTLLQMQLELRRQPKPAPAAPQPSGKDKRAAAAGKNAAAAKDAAEGDGGAATAVAPAGSSEQQQAAEAAAEEDSPPPDPLKLAQTATLGPHETWTATVQVKGDAQRGTLRFVPLHMQRVGAAHDTVQLTDQALLGLMGLGNATSGFDAYEA